MNANQAFTYADLMSAPQVKNGAVYVNGKMLSNGNQPYQDAYWQNGVLVVNEVPHGGQQTTWFYVGSNCRFMGHNGQIDGSNIGQLQQAIQRAENYRHQQENQTDEDFSEDYNEEDDDNGIGMKILKWIGKILWKIITLPFKLLWWLIRDTMVGR